MWLPFNQKLGVAVKVNNAGASSTVQQVRSENGGGLSFEASYSSGRNALRYPAYDGAASGPRAVLAVTSSGTTDALNPRGRAFTIGADIRLDPANEGSYGDNGNNVLQRGLYDQASQYKIQVDHDQASCRVKGRGGSTILVSSRTIATGSWYQLTCRRINVTGPDRFTFAVRSIRSDGSLGAATTVSSMAATGKLSFPSTTPLSVGGKLNDDLSIVGASDQFNGKIDNAYFRVD